MAQPSPSRPRRRVVVLAVLVAVALLMLVMRWVSHPDRVAGLILAQAGDALGLEISASGASEYRLRGTPRLVIRDVVARQPGVYTPLLRAERIHLELPWATIRALGVDLTVKRIELDAPQLDLAALQRWQATRPPSQTRIPTLTDGLQVVRGRVIGDGWSIEAIDLDLPALYPQRAVAAHLRGRLVSGTTRMPFDVHAALTRPAARAGLGVAGTMSVVTATWALPMAVTLSARLYQGVEGLGLDRTKLAADARYRSAGTDLSFALGLAGPLRYSDGSLAIAPLGVALRGQGVMPQLDAHGRFAFAQDLALQLDGRLASWPQAWPALPAPIGQSDSPLPFVLDYRGPADLSGISALQLQRDATRFDGRFALPAVLDWIDAGAKGSPLPPLSGRLQTPRLEIAGAVLQGVEVDFGNEAAPLP
ncbi:hypothetical protein ACFOLC_03290 [Lysobacter cavernae]|uniref:AsmA family protein n=1 Tax=Lysobacter cavernae TaxID=1685901 RepID=A0ABV7RP84_9GAMM